jgi:hypothetical protein
MWIEELKPGAAMKEILPHGLATVVELTYKDPSGRPRGAHALHGLGATAHTARRWMQRA